MGNFNDFINNNSQSCSDAFSSAENNSKYYENKKERGKLSNEELEDMINEYQKLSSDELMSEFVKLTLEKKRKGELTSKELSNIRNTILPYLNTEQKNMLEKLLDMVENV